MPMFWGDYLRDTGHLSPAEHGAYLMLIAHQWTTAKPLADDDARLARIAKMTAREWKSAKANIVPFFTIRNGEWSQKRVADELIKAKQAFDRRSAAGMRGGIAKAKLKPGSGNAEAMNKQPKPKPEPKPLEASSLASRDGDLSPRETFLAACWSATKCDPDKHPFTEVVFGQWWGEGVILEDLSIIPPMLDRERIREGDPSLVKTPGYYTPAIRRQRMQRQADTTQGSDVEEALKKWRNNDAA
jgi:uncharacterized protein YdaU (DUF1376 family)